MSKIKTSYNNKLFQPKKHQFNTKIPNYNYQQKKRT